MLKSNAHSITTRSWNAPTRHARPSHATVPTYTPSTKIHLRPYWISQLPKTGALVSHADLMKDATLTNATMPASSHHYRLSLHAYRGLRYSSLMRKSRLQLQSHLHLVVMTYTANLTRPAPQISASVHNAVPSSSLSLSVTAPTTTVSSTMPPSNF